jgi:hypothetical protein
VTKYLLYHFHNRKYRFYIGPSLDIKTCFSYNINEAILYDDIDEVFRKRNYIEKITKTSFSYGEVEIVKAHFHNYNLGQNRFYL